MTDKLRELIAKWREIERELATHVPGMERHIELREGGRVGLLLDELETALAQPPEPGLTFQQRVRQWTLACFGQAIADDKIERNHRFLEESLELVQALGCTQSEAHQLVDYVFSRPQGTAVQECGGVLVTLAALCNANGLNMEPCGSDELARVYTKIDQIRAKQAAKPKHSPLSLAASPDTPVRATVSPGATVSQSGPEQGAMPPDTPAGAASVWSEKVR
jgi:hypothetical protein